MYSITKKFFKQYITNTHTSQSKRQLKLNFFRNDDYKYVTTNQISNKFIPNSLLQINAIKLHGLDYTNSDLSCKLMNYIKR